MVSPDGIVLENLMRPGLLPQLLDWLAAQPWPGYYKRAVLQGWAHIFNVKPSQADYARMDASGWRKP